MAQLLTYRDDFLYTICKRQGTSPSNKGLHQRLIDSITAANYEDMYNQLFNPYYFNNCLRGVIFCMDTDLEHKHKIVKTYEWLLENM